MKYFVTTLATKLASSKKAGDASPVGSTSYWDTLQDAEDHAKTCIKSGQNVYLGEIKDMEKVSFAAPPIVREKVV